jgi:uncharacterized protein (TIGR03435 family)
LLCVPIVLCGVLAAQPLSFEVATVKPNDPARNPGVTSGYSMNGNILQIVGSLDALIRYAYDVEDTQISGGPQWIDRDIYEVNAKMPAKAIPAQLKQMMQSLLAERFQLTIHRETRQLPIYSLVVAKGGSKLHPPDENVTGSSWGATSMRGTMDIASFAGHLTSSEHRTVVDNTGLKGYWKFDLHWAADDSTTEASLFTAIQEQLGLKLESTKGPVQVLVIDRAEKPSEN